MRVLLVADCVGGVWQFAIELANGLARRADRVALATMGAPLRADQEREAAAIAGLELYPSAYRLLWMEDAWDDVVDAGHWLMRVAEDFRPDVVHLNDFGHGGLPWNVPVLLTAHSCVLSWWRAVHGSEAPNSWQRYRHVVRRALHSVNRVVAPTCAMLRAIETYYGTVAVRQVIANGRTGPERCEVNAKEPLVLAAGRLWDEGKNLSALAEVAPVLDWPVYVAGDRCHPNGGARELSSVRQLGPLPQVELERWFARAAIYVLPARYEPFGLSVLEAAQAGCALVLGDIPSLREVWADAALYVAPDDHSALTATLRRLIRDDTLRRWLGLRARRRAMRYTAHAMVERYRRVYSALQASGAAPLKRQRSLCVPTCSEALD